MLVGGRVLAGAHGAAGEVGYSLRGCGDTRAFADGAAPLEELAGGRFIGVRASRLTGRSLTAADAFAAEDKVTRELVDDALDELGVHVANMALLLDPERIAVGGGMMESGDRVLAALARRLQQALPFRQTLFALASSTMPRCTAPWPSRSTRCFRDRPPPWRQAPADGGRDRRRERDPPAG